MQKVVSNNPALQPASPVPLASVCVAQKIKKKRKKQKKHYLITTELPSRLYFSFSVIQQRTADSLARFTQRHFFKSGYRHFFEPNLTRHSTRRRKFSSLLNLECGGRLKLTLHLRQVRCQVIDCLSCRFQILTHFQCIYTTLCCKGYNCVDQGQMQREGET